ncbi:transposase [Streptomyces sp. NPDC001009]
MRKETLDPGSDTASSGAVWRHASSERLVEPLVPDGSWDLHRRVVPPMVMQRPQGGGRRCAGDREVLAATVFVATSGCTWRQLPPVFAARWQTVYCRFAQWSHDRVWARVGAGRRRPAKPQVMLI